MVKKSSFELAKPTVQATIPHSGDFVRNKEERLPLWFRVARAADGIEAWEARFNRWECGERGVGLGLIPVGDGEEIVGADVGVAMLDGGAERFSERDG